MRTRSLRTALGTGCVVLVLAGIVSRAEGPPAFEAKPGTMIVLGDTESDHAKAHTLAYAWDGKSRRTPKLFRWRSDLAGCITTFALGHDGRQYYSGAYGKLIVRADSDGEKCIYTHRTRVQDLVLDDDDNVYFSEARGTAGDGKIYRLKLAEGGAAATAELVCTVPLEKMQPDPGNPTFRFWAGNFAFGRTAKGQVDTDTLYLSSGNTVGAIFRITRKKGEWSDPTKVFQFGPMMLGLVFTSPHTAYFASYKHVYKLTDLRKAEVVLNLPDPHWVWHLSVVPEPKAKK
jgi:hypothetical protein